MPGTTCPGCEPVLSDLVSVSGVGGRGFDPSQRRVCWGVGSQHWVSLGPGRTC